MEKKSAPHIRCDTFSVLAPTRDIQSTLTAYNIKKIMTYKNRNKQYPKRVTLAQRKEDELPVYSNLVVTPSQMLKMAENGIPVSLNNTSFRPDDGEINPSFDITLDQIRGVDPAAMWEQSQIIKQKARRAHIRDRQRFGDEPLKDE